MPRPGLLLLCLYHVRALVTVHTSLGSLRGDSLGGSWRGVPVRSSTCMQHSLCSNQYSTLSASSAQYAALTAVCCNQYSDLRVRTQHSPQCAAIQYAEQPVGSNRWKAPRPKLPWTQTLDVSSHSGPACPQDPSELHLNSSTMSEACLFMDIWAPQSANASSQLPVLVWLYGNQTTPKAHALPFVPVYSHPIIE